MIQIAYVQNTKSTKNNTAKQLHFMKTTISIFSSERFTVTGGRTVFRLESKICIQLCSFLACLWISCLNISFLAEIATPFLLVPIPPPTELELFMVVPLWIFHCLVCLKLQRSGNSIPYFDF